MHGIGVRFLASALMFLIGVSVSTTWRALIRTNREGSENRGVVLPATPVTDQELTFTLTYLACGAGWAHGYESSDGEKLVEGSHPYGTQASAKRALRKRLEGSLEILEQTYVWDLEGRRTEKVVAVFPPDQVRANKWVSVLWVDGISIHNIDAPTLRHAEIFQRTRSFHR